MAKPKGIPKIRVKARIASKVREKDLLENAKLMMDDPELILPECAQDCGSCPFRKTRARLLKIQQYKDNPAKLAKFARGGDKLARAYAATIGLVHEEKTAYLATATYPGGTITYALRGKMPKEKLIGVQNFDSPRWRVLSVVDLVQKKGLHFYSYGDHFVCTGRYARPPEDYVSMAAESVGATRFEGSAYSCPHTPASVDHIEFNWVSAGKKVLLCDLCAVKSKNTLRKLAEGMAVPKALTEFEISVVRPLKMVDGGEDCKDLLNKPTDEDLLEEYSEGRIGDRELIDRHLASVRQSLKSVNTKAYVRGDRCFGADLDAFISDMTQDDVERKVLHGLLSKVQHPVVMDSSDTVNRLLSTYWSEHGKEALSEVVGEALASKYYKDDEASRISPLKVVQQALGEARHTEVSSQIPNYSCLSSYGEFVDEVARAYKTKGQQGAIAVLDGEKSNDHRIRSLTNAFYLALGVTTKSWKFTDSERDYGKHLQQYAKSLLDSAESEEHHEAFESLLREAGCSEDLKRA